MASKQQETFRLHLVGKTVRPESVSLGRLTDCLRAVQRLIGATDSDVDDQEDDGSEPSAPDVPLHLLDVQRGSAVYPVYATNADAVLERLKLVGQAVNDPELVAPYRGIVQALDDLSALARKLDCRIEFRRNKTADRAVIATIKPDTFASLHNSLYLTGPTSITAVVERAGGKVRRHCGLRLPQQPRRQLTCQVVSDDLVRRLGQSLYQTVTVHGQATWYRYDWTITGMVVESMEVYEPVAPTELLEEMRKIAGPAWSRIEDPQAYLQEARG